MKNPILLTLLALFLSSQLFSQSHNFIYTPEGKRFFKTSTERFLVIIDDNTTAAKQKSYTKGFSSKIKSVQELGASKNTYLVSLEKNTDQKSFSKVVSSFKAQANVRFISPEIIFDGSNTTSFFQTRIMVKLKSPDNLQLLKKVAKQYPVILEPQDELAPNIFYLSYTGEAIHQLVTIANDWHKSNLFEFVEIDRLQKIIKFNTNDRFLNRQWALNNTGDNIDNIRGVANADMQVFEAWGITTGSPDITIAVLDDGIEGNHPDLRNNVVSGYDAFGEGKERNPNSDADHGTPVAGIIAAEGNNGIGITGVAYNCKLMPIRIDRGDNDFIENSKIATAINWAWYNGADILSNSWTFNSPDASSSIINDAIENAVTRGRDGLGSIVLFSAGNNNSAVSYPANNINVIAVGATSNCDERKRSSDLRSELTDGDTQTQLDPLGVSCDGINGWGSNFGAGLDIAAPGPWILTTDLVGERGTSNMNYDFFSGTSASCPNAAGVVALILSVNPTLNQQEARGILESTCDKVGGYDYNFVSNQPNGRWSRDLGYGRVNAYRAVTKAAETLNREFELSLYEAITFSPTQVNVGGELEVRYNVINRGNETFRGTFSADLFTLDGEHVLEIDRIEGEVLPSSHRFNNSLTFSTQALDVPPGTYRLSAYYQPEGGKWFALDEGSYQNPIEIRILEEQSDIDCDLELWSQIEWDRRFVRNKSIEFSYDVANLGDSAFRGHFRIDLHDPTTGEWIMNLGKTDLETINSRRYKEMSFHTLGVNLASGYYGLIAWYFPSGGEEWTLLEQGDYSNPTIIYLSSQLQEDEEVVASFSGNSNNGEEEVIANFSRNSNNRDEELFNVSSFPNPAQSHTTLKIESGKATTAKVLLQSVDGRIVKEFQADLVEGIQTIPIDLSNLSSGMYLFNIKTQNQYITSKIIID